MFASWESQLKHQLDVRGASALLAAPFIPGARLPMITVGVGSRTWRGGKSCALKWAARVITAPVQMLIGVGVAKLGSQFESDAHREVLYIGAILAVVVPMFMIHTVTSRCAAKHPPPRAPVGWLHGLSIAKRFERPMARLASARVVR